MVDQSVWQDWMTDFPTRPDYACGFPSSEVKYDGPSEGTTLIGVEALMDVVRPSGDEQNPWAVYRYAVKFENGKAYMTGPIKHDIPGGHYPKNIPPWKLRPPDD